MDHKPAYPLLPLDQPHSQPSGAGGPRRLDLLSQIPARDDRYCCVGLSEEGSLTNEVKYKAAPKQELLPRNTH